ncbi:MAG: hypothetical protein M3Q22_00520 [Actinomycetota bacterium]|nr:hypothetical protein [Actinomycetota bacterium]
MTGSTIAGSSRQVGRRPVRDAPLGAQAKHELVVLRSARSVVGATVTSFTILGT